MDGIHEVTGSTPVSSTNLRLSTRSRLASFGWQASLNDFYNIYALSEGCPSKPWRSRASSLSYEALGEYRRLQLARHFLKKS